MEEDNTAIDFAKLGHDIWCRAQVIYRANGVFEGRDPQNPFIPLFFIQLTLSMIATNLVPLVLKPLNQPAFVGELLAGILLGPSVLGRIDAYRRLVFSNSSFSVLEPMAQFFICHYGFLMGLKMDISLVKNIGRKAKIVAVIGTIIPFLVGLVIFFFMKDPDATSFIYVSAPLTVTGYPGLTRILENQQIFHSEIGKIVMVASHINVISSWILLGIALFVGAELTAFHFIAIVGFFLVSHRIIRPLLRRIIQKTQRPQGYSEFYLCSIVIGMLFYGALSDATGMHPIIGCFTFGLLVPDDVFRATLVNKLEGFMQCILLPVYIVVCGLRTNIDRLTDDNIGWERVGPFMALACLAKPLSAIFISFFRDIPFKEAMLVGLLGNNKSVIALIILEISHVEKAQKNNLLGEQKYTIMVLSILLMTMATTPSIACYRRITKPMPYTRRTIQNEKLGEEFRILACVYETHHISTAINLLETTNPLPGSHISVFGLHLVELKGHAATSSVISVHTSSYIKSQSQLNPSNEKSQRDEIISAFYNYEQQHRDRGLRMQTITAWCPYSTMHVDICNIAKDNRVTLIVIPFHKLLTPEGKLEDIKPNIRNVNDGVLESAPCSVGIFFDRSSGVDQNIRKIIVLYFGGPDDREALAYALRMAAGDNAKQLTVVRFIPSSKALLKRKGITTEESFDEHDDNNNINAFPDQSHIEAEREKMLDDEFLARFNALAADNPSMDYNELVLDDEEETIRAMKSMDEHQYDLYLVGRGRGTEPSPLIAGLVDWCDYPELGPVGDMLVTSEFESPYAVLVVQQYVKGSDEVEVMTVNVHGSTTFSTPFH